MIAILDSVRVTFNEPGTSGGESVLGSTLSRGTQSYNLKEFATVGVKDGALLLTCFDVEVSGGTKDVIKSICCWVCSLELVCNFSTMSVGKAR